MTTASARTTLRVTDLGRAARFYTHVLGFRVTGAAPGKMALAAPHLSRELVLTTFAFRFVRADSFTDLFDGMYQAGRWPVSIYPGWLRFGVTFLVTLAQFLLLERRVHYER